MFADPDYHLGLGGLADRPRAGRADERARPAARDAAAERRRRGHRPRLQRRPRIDQPVHRDDERPRAPARADAHSLHDSERARHAGQLLERERSRQRWRDTTSSTSRSSGSRSRQTHAVLRTGNHVRFVTNLNGLLRFPWINGVKTGHTLDAGYVLVASGTQGGMTLIDAVLGTSSEAARDSNALALLHWGFANFGLRTPVHAGKVLARPRRSRAEHAGRARAADRGLHLHARVPALGDGDAARARAGAAHRPAARTVVRRVGVSGRESPGRYPNPPAAGVGACRRIKKSASGRKRGGRIGYAVRTSGGSGCGDRADNVLARMDEGNEGRQA